MSTKSFIDQLINDTDIVIVTVSHAHVRVDNYVVDFKISLIIVFLEKKRKVSIFFGLIKLYESEVLHEHIDRAGQLSWHSSVVNGMLISQRGQILVVIPFK